MQIQNIQLPKIRCHQVNHNQMNFEFICLEKQCLQFNKNPLCFCCIQQLHHQHIESTLSLSQFITECIRISQPKTKDLQNLTNQEHQQFFKLQNLLLKGISSCKTRQQLSGILQQIYKATFKYTLSKQRKEELLNQQINKMKGQTQRHYHNKKNNKNDNLPKNKKSLTTNTPFTIPILSFLNKDESITSQNYEIISPFQINHKKTKSMSSIFGYPSLSTLTQSTQIFIKILRLTPNWMGIGVSVGQNKYQQSSKSHITLMSNGWINQRGTILKSNNLNFKAGHTIKILWNKDKKHIIFRNTQTRNQQTIKFAPEWNEQIYLCVTMFFQGDSVAIVQQQIQ